MTEAHARVGSVDSRPEEGDGEKRLDGGDGQLPRIRLPFLKKFDESRLR